MSSQFSVFSFQSCFYLINISVNSCKLVVKNAIKRDKAEPQLKALRAWAFYLIDGIFFQTIANN